MTSYTSVSSRQTNKIALTILMLNGLAVKVTDILNNYIKTGQMEKGCTTLNTEFGELTRKVALIVLALSGLK